MTTLVSSNKNCDKPYKSLLEVLVAFLNDKFYSKLNPNPKQPPTTKHLLEGHNNNHPIPNAAPKDRNPIVRPFSKDNNKDHKYSKLKKVERIYAALEREEELRRENEKQKCEEERKKAMNNQKNKEEP
jgi:hypothetical protein